MDALSNNTNVTAAALGAALGCIIVYLCEAVAGVDIPTAVEGAVVVVATFVVGYLVKPTTPNP